MITLTTHYLRDDSSSSSWCGCCWNIANDAIRRVVYLPAQNASCTQWHQPGMLPRNMPDRHHDRMNDNNNTWAYVDVFPINSRVGVNVVRFWERLLQRQTSTSTQSCRQDLAQTNENIWINQILRDNSNATANLLCVLRYYITWQACLKVQKRTNFNTKFKIF